MMKKTIVIKYRTDYDDLMCKMAWGNFFKKI